jgi:hypothetical protein
MPPRSSKTTCKPPPEVAAPYPPFGHHPSNPSNNRLLARDHSVEPRPLQLPPPKKTISHSKSVSAPKAKQPPPRGRSAAPTSYTYSIFNNDASTTTTSSLTLDSTSIVPSRRKSPPEIPRPRSQSRPAISSTVEFPPIPPNNQLRNPSPSPVMVPYVKASEACRTSRVADQLAREKAAQTARYALDLEEVRRQKERFADMET